MSSRSQHTSCVQHLIWVVDDHPAARASMVEILQRSGYVVRDFPSPLEALKQLDHESPELILTDLQMPGMNGLEFTRALQQQGCDAQIVMVTAYASVSTAVEAMRSGAFDYIEKPFEVEQLEEIVLRALRHGVHVGKRSAVPSELESSVALIGSSVVMQLLRTKIQQIGATAETVLISGESGTGKELVAQAIHAASSRAKQAMVSVNCPALSPQLMESELFGHERGAFTSADAPRIGRFELAEGGTIFLDEVTELELPLQAKLLRVLQEREFERVGTSRSQSVNVRVLAATNRDILAEAQAGRFRHDLYYRLAVLPIHVPPLRERATDVPELAQHFLHRVASRMGKAPAELGNSALAMLCEYHWPGNVRELENLITRASVLATQRVITADELRPWLEERPTSQETQTPTPYVAGNPAMRLEEMERQLIETTLERFAGHREKTAKALGIGVRTLTNKMRQYGYSPRAKVFSKTA
jgi:DNA-binding NtrC family response regulator